jgi:hypothetical protein
MTTLPLHKFSQRLIAVLLFAMLNLLKLIVTVLLLAESGKRAITTLSTSL